MTCSAVDAKLPAETSRKWQLEELHARARIHRARIGSQALGTKLIKDWSFFQEGDLELLVSINSHSEL